MIIGGDEMGGRGYVRSTRGLLWCALLGVAIAVLGGCGMGVKDRETTQSGTTADQLTAYFEAIRPRILAYYTAAKDVDAANADFNAGRIEACLPGYEAAAGDYRKAADVIGSVDPPPEIDSVDALTMALRDKATSAKKITRILGSFVAGDTTVGQAQAALDAYIPTYQAKEAAANEALAKWDQDLQSLSKELSVSAPEWWTAAAAEAQ